MSSYSFTLRPDSRICIALSRLPTVTGVAIFSLRRMPKVRTVARLGEDGLAGELLEHLAALVRRSDSPTEMFSTSL